MAGSIDCLTDTQSSQLLIDGISVGLNEGPRVAMD